MRYLALLLAGLAAWGGEPEGSLTSGRVTLSSRSRHKDYERATFSFEHGLRDDPGLHRTHNDWDLLFGNGADRFSVNTVADDRSRIIDLGAMTLAEVKRLPAFPAGGKLDNIPAVEGHVYVVHTRDRDSDYLSLFRVVKLLAGDRCTIDWVHFVPTPNSRPLDLDRAVRARLRGALGRVAKAERRVRRARLGVLRDPAAIMIQVSTGAQGGNRSRLTLAGRAHRLPQEPSARPLEIRRAPRTRDEPSWFLRCGMIPEGKALVISGIDIYATAAGDSNGDGEVRVRLGDEEVFHVESDGGPYQVWNEGVAVLRPGEEDRFFLQIANSSSVEVRFAARLVDLEQAAGIKPKRFHPAPAPARRARAAGEVADARPYVLLEPKVLLQVRAGAGGGNPNRITMLGRGSIYLDRVVNKPLPFQVPIAMHDDATAYFSGGRVPRGKIFVIKRIEYVGTAAGDTNGHGGFLVQVRDVRIVTVRDKPGPIKGVWEGRIPIRRGEERQVYLEVANSSTGDVTMVGELIADK